MGNKKTEKRICLVQFVDSFFLLFFFLQFFSRVSRMPFFFSSTKSTKATSKKFKMYGSLWLHPQRWTTNTCQISDITIVSPTMLGSCICFVIITSFTRYYLLGGPSLILVVVFFFFFCLSVMLNEQKCTQSLTPTPNERNKVQRHIQPSIRFIPKIKSESFYFHVLSMNFPFFLPVVLYAMHPK